jgi:hypothetical protein
VHLLLDIANVCIILTILVILMMEAIRSSETLVVTTATLRHIPEDDALHIHRGEILNAFSPQIFSPR